MPSPPAAIPPARALVEVHVAGVSILTTDEKHHGDDFTIKGDRKDLLEERVLPGVRVFLLERGLRLSEATTSIRHIQEGFDVLGFTIRIFGEKLPIKPSRGSISRFLKELRQLIKPHVGSSVDVLIRVLDARLRGSGQYYRHVVSKGVPCKAIEVRAAGPDHPWRHTDSSPSLRVQASATPFDPVYTIHIKPRRLRPRISLNADRRELYA